MQKGPNRRGVRPVSHAGPVLRKEQHLPGRTNDLLQRSRPQGHLPQQNQRMEPLLADVAVGLSVAQDAQQGHQVCPACVMCVFCMSCMSHMNRIQHTLHTNPLFLPPCQRKRQRRRRHHNGRHHRHARRQNSVPRP